MLNREFGINTTEKIFQNVVLTIPKDSKNFTMQLFI